ncbi:uncharacterized protein [Panulirus ornatus]|uniref:uncharacterized protein n=1 Tax=Panulirus ornatus TaxID=150431 RepID=UPI003A852629
MLSGKQRCLGLVAIVVVVAAFGALVGVSCWHMAYQEASLEAAVREQRTLDFARKSCSAYVAKMLHQQSTSTEQLEETPLKTETPQSTDVAQTPTTVTSRPADTESTSPKKVKSVAIQSRKVMIGLLTSRDVMIHTAQVAIHDLIQGGLVTLEPHLASPPRQHLETLAGYVQRLHQDSGVRVFVGWLTEEEVGVVAKWAKDRPRPRHPVVLVLLSAPTGLWSASREEHLEADFAVVSMTPPRTAALSASLLQMQERGVRRVLPLLPDTAAADILATQLASWNLSSLNMEVLGLVRYDVSIPAHEVVAAAGAALQSYGSEAVGVLLTAGPNLADLVTCRC